MIELTRELLSDESGATAIEYALIGSLVSVAAIAAMQAFGTSVINLYGFVSDIVLDADGTIDI